MSLQYSNSVYVPFVSHSHRNSVNHALHNSVYEHLILFKINPIWYSSNNGVHSLHTCEHNLQGLQAILTSSATWISWFSCFRKLPSTVIKFPSFYCSEVQLSALAFPHQSFRIQIVKIEKPNLSKIRTFSLPLFRFHTGLPATSFPHYRRQK